MSAGNEYYPVRLRYDGCAQQLVPGGLGFLEIYDVILHQIDLYNGVATIDSTGKTKKMAHRSAPQTPKKIFRQLSSYKLSLLKPVLL